jgi:hypothetical protein
MRRKRAYVPKTKGCYECSQRRIHCDRAQPQCAKCVAKGLSCSGLGIRYRFNDDVVRRSIRDDGILHWDEQGVSGSSSTVPAHSGCTTASTHPDDAELNDCRFDVFQLNPSDAPIGDDPALPPAVELADDDSIIDLDAEAGNNATHTETLPEDALALTTLRPFQTWQEYLLEYFSTMIAPEMVPVDDARNGWRHLILPLAHTDRLIRDAVLSASAFHFSTTVSAGHFAPDAMYHRAIRSLRQRQDLQSYNMAEKQTVMLSLLVFLTTVLVSGSSDHRIVLRLLDAAISAAGGDEALKSSELGLFIVRQNHKFRGYASPLLGQAEGIAILSQTSAMIRPSSSPGWDDFTSYYNFYKNHQTAMSMVYNLHEQACNIYVQRAQTGLNGPALTEQVTTFRNTLEKFPSGSAAENILVWPIFLAALESTSADDQQYFLGHLMAHHRRNGFANILTALAYLRHVWAKQNTVSWTQALPSMEAFIV